jgi:DNA-binding transcriptional ArsR family regulator
MVEYTLSLDSIFGSLADATRRDILRRVSQDELSVTEIARPYGVSLAAVSKHLKILEQARLIVKHRIGKRQLVRASPLALKDAADYLHYYEQLWEVRFDRLEEYLDKEQQHGGN